MKSTLNFKVSGGRVPHFIFDPNDLSKRKDTSLGVMSYFELIWVESRTTGPVEKVRQVPTGCLRQMFDPPN